MERTTPRQIGELVDKLIEQYNLDKPMASHKASWLWTQVVGEGVNAYTTRRRVIDGVLHVWISSAPLKNELSFQKATIMEAINRQLPKNPITDIRFH